jgi:hypothetical protein
MSKQHKMELARTLCASDSPINKSQLAKVLGIARSSLYVQCKRPRADKALAVRIEAAHEKDDTMGHRKLACTGYLGHPFRKLAFAAQLSELSWHVRWEKANCTSPITPFPLARNAMEQQREPVHQARQTGACLQHGLQEARWMQGQRSSFKGILTIDDAILAHLDSLMKGQADVSSLSHPSIVMVQTG